MRHNAPACADAYAELGSALGWGRCEPRDFTTRLDGVAERIGLRKHLLQTPVPDDIMPVMARDAVAIRRLIDPNPCDVTEADALRMYRTVLAPTPSLSTR